MNRSQRVAGAEKELKMNVKKLEETHTKLRNAKVIFRRTLEEFIGGFSWPEGCKVAVPKTSVPSDIYELAVRHYEDDMLVVRYRYEIDPYFETIDAHCVLGCHRPRFKPAHDQIVKAFTDSGYQDVSALHWGGETDF